MRLGNWRCTPRGSRCSCGRVPRLDEQTRGRADRPPYAHLSRTLSQTSQLGTTQRHVPLAEVLAPKTRQCPLLRVLDARRLRARRDGAVVAADGRGARDEDRREHAALLTEWDDHTGNAKGTDGYTARSTRLLRPTPRRRREGTPREPDGWVSFAQAAGARSSPTSTGGHAVGPRGGFAHLADARTRACLPQAIAAEKEVGRSGVCARDRDRVPGPTPSPARDRRSLVPHVKPELRRTGSRRCRARGVGERAYAAVVRSTVRRAPPGIAIHIVERSTRATAPKPRDGARTTYRWIGSGTTPRLRSRSVRARRAAERRGHQGRGCQARAHPHGRTGGPRPWPSASTRPRATATEPRA